jgi:uncharacterized protein YyaL (SSP411 family)
MPNRLFNETSPYLLQHADNPVDWYPWGAEALEKARAENKPIFLSIGYAACHWCHVMAHESFEDPQTAQMMNEAFVNIKVDREERPDLDGIYMNAVVSMTGHGGWPMSVFLTPEGEPFYGGTYFPPARRYGMPSFREVLHSVAQAWNTEREEILRVSADLRQSLQQSGGWGTQPGALRPQVLEQAAQALLKNYDWRMGGWGSAPRFPQPMAIEFLLMQAARGTERALDAATHALQIMHRGGLYDVVGGGFHRYSTDDLWLVPHFEKMLYDNGQLALVYLHAYQATGAAAFGQVCTETLDFILREMTHPEGGFYSSLDADSEGVEGKYYVWTPDEIAAALPDPDILALIRRVYTITEPGNFEHRNILQRNDDLNRLATTLGMNEETLIDQLTAAHHKLYAAREERVRPATDDKVLVAWNALALRAFAQAARTLNRTDYLAAAQKNADFLLRALYSGGRLLRAWRNGAARHNAVLEDHAGLILALLDLYQSDADPRWFQAALQLAEDMQVHFRDPRGGYFDTREDQQDLITRPKELQDNAVPSGNALAALALLELAAFDDRGEWHSIAEEMIASLQEVMVKYPTAFGFWLQAADFAAGPVRQIALVGQPDRPETAALLEEIWRKYRPRTVVALANPKAAQGYRPGLLRDRPMQGDTTTVYVCEGFTCNFPVTSVEELRRQLE